MRCVYRGKAIERDVVEINTTVASCCPHNVTKIHQVFTCELLGRCMPFYRCKPTAIAETVVNGVWAKPCKGCELIVSPKAEASRLITGENS